MATKYPSPDLSRARWHKARASSGTGGCVSIAILDGGLVAVRDDKDPARSVHIHPRQAWLEFTTQLAQRGSVSFATASIQVDVAAAGVTLRDLDGTAPAHSFTHFEWDCFLDGVRNREPELAGVVASQLARPILRIKGR